LAVGWVLDFDIDIFENEGVGVGVDSGGGVNPDDFLRFLNLKEYLRMDAHFSEYLAAVRAMQEIYGERAEDFPTEFHREAERHNETGACQECLGV
jgi:hypothetical protein